MYAFNLSRFIKKIGVFLHSLKLTVKAALWGIFSIATMVTVITAFG